MKKYQTETVQKKAVKRYLECNISTHAYKQTGILFKQSMHLILRNQTKNRAFVTF